jgi:acetyl esterase/lipase
VQKDYLYDPVHRLTLDVYLPQFAATPLPAVLLIHGGGWKYFNKGAASGYARYLASNGFAAVTIDYRLSSEANWPTQLDDLRTAVRWLHSHGLDFGIDPLRMAVLGDSAGAHLAAMLALRGTGVAGHKISAVVAYLAFTTW